MKSELGGISPGTVYLSLSASRYFNMHDEVNRADTGNWQSIPIA